MHKVVFGSTCLECPKHTCVISHNLDMRVGFYQVGCFHCLYICAPCGPWLASRCWGVTLLRAVLDLVIFVGWNKGRSYCSGRGKQEQQICPLPGWKGKFSPPSFLCGGEKESFDFFFPFSSEVELKEIQVSFSYIPAKPLETKICKLSGHFQCPSNRHFFCRHWLHTADPCLGGCSVPGVLRQGWGQSSKVLLVPVAIHDSTARPELCKDSSTDPVVKMALLGFTEEGPEKSQLNNIFGLVAGWRESEYRKRGKENPEKLL